MNKKSYTTPATAVLPLTTAAFCVPVSNEGQSGEGAMAKQDKFTFWNDEEDGEAEEDEYQN